MDIERSLLRVPFELYSRDFRLSQKRIEKEMARIAEEIAGVDPGATAQPQLLAQLAVWEEQLLQLAREHEATVQAEARYGKTLALRLQHLIDGYSGGKPNATFDTARTNRLIIGSLLLHGCIDSARLLANSRGLTELVDTDVFERLHSIGGAILSHNVQPALDWAATLASRLRRIKSPLVLQLRRFEFLQLVASGQKKQAMDHATLHFGALAARTGAAAGDGGDDGESKSPDSATVRQMQQDMGMMIYPDPVHCGVPMYERLFRDERWEELRQLFFTEAGRALGFEVGASALDVVLQAGLTALKLPSCHATAVAKVDLDMAYGPPAKQRIARGECPACHPFLADVAKRLPSCRRTKSTIICGLARTKLEGDNYPLALPNGFVYGRDALQRMAMQNDGKVVCPRTLHTVKYSDARRAYMS